MITILLLLLFSGTATAQPALALIERALALKHPVAQLKTDSLATRLSTQDSTGVLLFDVRRADEFAVSRIRGAVRADPDLSADEFARMFAGALKEKELVFYCSVGYRSSILLERVQQQALDAGVVSLANLRGGIFRWYNERRPLHDGTGKVDNVHRYDAFWGRLLKKRCLGLICL
ncbi:MAG: rhodanese-like domain-containing protein [Candidatus Latescibacterota bacterium]|nr:rhodanese-like domain-containing protein [Candidatus Latescibacterota bacterium]